MSAETITLRGRIAIEKLMTDSCTITRTTGSSTNLQTGAVTKTTTRVADNYIAVVSTPCMYRAVRVAL